MTTFNIKTAKPAWPKYDIIFSLSSIHIAANTTINKIPVILFTILILDEIKFSANLLIIIPRITGTVTTSAILRAIPVIVISEDKSVTPNNFAEVKTINGTEKILIKLPIAVNEIDYATSPFANFVKTFDVTPPGAAAIIINPKANSTGNLNIKSKI